MLSSSSNDTTSRIHKDGVVSFAAEAIHEWMEDMGNDTDPRGPLMKGLVEDVFRGLANNL